MSTFHRVIAALAIGSFAAILLLAVIGHFFEIRGVIRNRAVAATFMKLSGSGLFLILSYSLIPLMLHVFLVAQAKIGNGNVSMVRFLSEHERGVVYTIWGMCTAGLLIALPFMWTDFFGSQEPIGENRGAIITNIGLTIAETAARSTFKIPPASRESLTGSSRSVSEGVLDFEIVDSGVRFKNCRYCWLHTGSHDDPKIVHINVGLSARKMPRAELADEHESIMRQLQTAGWIAGHFEYTDPQSMKLHGGTRSGEGRYWAKGSALLLLSEKRMDAAKPGEDPTAAGEFIHVIDVVPRDDGSYRDLIFNSGRAPATRPMAAKNSQII